MIFIWIPKTGGTSLYEEKLQKEGMYLFTQNYHLFNNIGSVTFGHACIKTLLKEGIIKKDYWDTQEKFCVVRNPYDRFISLYHDFLRSKRLSQDTTPSQFAQALKHLTRKPGMYNALDFSQCASQVDWFVPGVEIKRLENIGQELPKINENKLPKEDYYNKFSGLRKMVTDLYYDDFTLLNYTVE